MIISTYAISAAVYITSGFKYKKVFPAACISIFSAFIWLIVCYIFQIIGIF